MYQVILFIHIFAAILLIALVLLQQGKGAAMGAAFGSGASQTVFGSRGSGSFLFRLTIGLVGVFFITSLGLNYLTIHQYKQASVLDLPLLPVKAKQPTAPATEQTTNTVPSPADIPAPRR